LRKGTLKKVAHIKTWLTFSHIGAHMANETESQLVWEVINLWLFFVQKALSFIIIGHTYHCITF